jgi:hypothetical protein
MLDSNEVLINNESLKSIERRIDLYRQDKLDLPRLTQDLLASASGMLSVSKDWQEKFMALWEVVEEINAFALAEDSYKPLLDHEEILEKTLSKIQILAQESCIDRKEFGSS